MLDGGTLLIIVAALQASSAQTLDVYQTPNISAIEHGFVTLFCNFTFHGTSIGYSKWYRDHAEGHEVANTSESYFGRVSIVSPEDFKCRKSANIQLHRLELSDSGLYICEVTLITSPIQTAYGNGTYLEVKQFVEDNTKLQLGITVSCSTIAVIAILIFTAVAIFLGYHKKLFDCLLLRMMGDKDATSIV